MSPTPSTAVVELPGVQAGAVHPSDSASCVRLHHILHAVHARMMVAEPSSPQFDHLLAPHPTVRTWMAAVREAVGPHVYDEAHAHLRAAVHRLAAAAGGGGGKSAASRL